MPEFLGRYIELVELADDDPGSIETFCELADFVEELTVGLEQFRPLLTRCLAAVEEVASTSDDAEELVGWSFLDYLSADTRRIVLPWLGPSTLAVLESIEDPIPTRASRAPSTQMTPFGPTLALWEIPLPSSTRSPGWSSMSWMTPDPSRT